MFSYNKNIFKQVFGLAMESQLSPVVEDIVIENLIEKFRRGLYATPKAFTKNYAQHICNYVQAIYCRKVKKNPTRQENLL